MLAVISPAKRLDFTSEATTAKHSLPAFLKESKQLIQVLRKQSPAELAKLMGLSADLADLNYERYGSWHTPFTPDNARQAALAFSGDVYLGLDARTLNDRDWAWAQKHLRILSGLYGLLKPLDLIQPYRLEMGTKLPNPGGEDLYTFWGERLTKALNEAVAEQSQPIIVNLASNEYWGAIDTKAVEARVITPVFKDLKNGRYRFLSFFAKKARGLMTRYIIENRVSTLKALKDFDAAGYYFCEAQSRGDNWVFLRDKPR
ncbi:MAG TPA: peroxide stress protein YaaA [Pseudomonadales bacterium]